MSGILQRIKEISQQERISLTAMETTIGASKGVLSRALVNGTDIQAKWLVKITENYPEYSPHWLLTGQGEMLLAGVLRDGADGYTSLKSATPKKTMDPKEELIDALRLVISTQETAIRSQEITITVLQKRAIELENLLSPGGDE